MNSSKPIVKTWNKLVRDNIPTNLASKGILSHVRIISSRSELLTLLIEKGEEEAKELQVAISNLRNAEETHDITEEAADLYEVRRWLKAVYKRMKDMYKTPEQNKKILDKITEIKSAVFNTLKKYKIDIRTLIQVANEKRKEKWWFLHGVYLQQTIELPHA